MNIGSKCSTVGMRGTSSLHATIEVGEKLSNNTPRMMPFLSSEILSNEKTTLGRLPCYREPFRDRLYDPVIDEFLKQEAKNGLPPAEVARRIGRQTEWMSHWLAAPGS